MLDCVADVAWFRDSEPIIISSKYWIYRKKESHFLTIFDIKREDCGNYRMVAFNKSGEIWHAVQLSVRGDLFYSAIIFSSLNKKIYCL